MASNARLGRVGPILKGSFPWIAIPVISCCVQLIWFSLRYFRYIDIDGIDYVGVAHHLSRGQFFASINAFRSPLLSWLIASLSWFTADLVWLGKFVTIGSFVGCLALLYKLTDELWDSPVAAALAVLWFTLARGVLPLSVLFVTPDFLLTGLVLAYYLTLVQCFRSNSKRSWFYLGAIHGVAFLAKAFALPWLGLTTLFAAFWRGRDVKETGARMALAFAIPFLFAASWAFVLHAKYGSYTTGDQFRTNLLQWTLHEKWPSTDMGLVVLRDESQMTDAYMVKEPIPLGSPLWRYRYSLRRLVPALLSAERHNLPLALKELFIVLTPGGALVFAFALVALRRERRTLPVQFSVAFTVCASSSALVVAYCMLAFDSRYILPIVPLLIAISVRFIARDHLRPDTLAMPAPWRTISLALIAIPLLCFLGYRSSPFRTLKRDFQASCYQAAQQLKSHSSHTIVTIGSGPYPEHGVGWEAGYTSAFLAGARVVAAADELPSPSTVSSLMLDLHKTAPDALMLWGTGEDVRYVALERALSVRYPRCRRLEISDLDTTTVGAIYVLEDAR
jgi:hypothetical protein